MSIRCGRLMAAPALLVFLSLRGGAQSPDLPLFKIELKSDEPLIAVQYICDLEEFRSHRRVATADMSPDDTFTFRDLPPGDYQLTIADRRGGIVHQDFLLVSAERPTVTVLLPRRKPSRPPSGPISVAQLQHPPSPKAFAAVVAAQRFSEAGDYRRAAEELEKAVRISPAYVEAYVNLAVEHIRLGQYERAVEEMRRASQIAKPGAPALCNLAYAQMKLRRYDEALQSVRDSLRADAGYPQAHYLLGALLARNPQTLADALPHLELAAKTLPSAESMLEMARKDWKRLRGD